MIIDLSRPVTEWHLPFLPYAMLYRSMTRRGSIQRLQEGKDAKYIALSASSLGDHDTLILPREYKRLLPEHVEHPTYVADIKNARSFQSKANMLEIFNSWADPQQGLRVALRTMDRNGHYVGLCWFERTSEGKPRRSVLMAAPIVEGEEHHFLFNGQRSKEYFEKAGVPHKPITVVDDYGDACVCTVPSRSQEEAKAKKDKKTGETLYYHDVRVSNLPLRSNDNHWANVVAETDNPDAIRKLRRVNKKLQMYWQDDGIAALLAIAAHKQVIGDPLRVALVPFVDKPLIHLDNRLRYNVFIETDPNDFYGTRPLSETERSYLMMALMQTVKEQSPRRNLYEYFFREDTKGLEEELIKIAA